MTATRVVPRERILRSLCPQDTPPNIRRIRRMFGMPETMRAINDRAVFESRDLPDGSREVWTTGPGAKRVGKITYLNRSSEP